MPSFPLLERFRKGHEAKKSETTKDRPIPSPTVMPTTSARIPEASMTGRGSSQPIPANIEPQSPANIEPQSPEQVTSIAPSTSSVHETLNTVSAEHPTPAASPAPTATSNTVASELPNVAEHLWDRAYEKLKAKESKLVDAYEKFLSRELKDGESSVASDPYENLIEQTNLVTRRSQMKALIEAGMKKIEREDKVKQAIGGAMQGVLSVKDIIGSALQPVPQAAIAWTGVCFALQILVNPTTETAANRKGVDYVISRMNWYCELSSLFKDDDGSSAGLRGELETRVLNLYEALLSFLLKSVCSYYRNRVLRFLWDAIKLNDWDGNVQAIQDVENVFRQDSGVYNNLQIKSSLEKLPSIYQVLQEQRLERMTEKDRQCIRDLRLIDSRDEINKIEERKDHLLKNSWEWILGCKEYQNFMNWEDGNKQRLLWIRGDAGKGKTMLLIGIIRELERLNSIPYSPNLSYIFCQGTNSMLNSPAAVLRCLVWLMLDQQPFLVSHIRKKYDTAGADLFKDSNAFYFLRDAFKSILKDPRLERVFLIVDALDECIDEDMTGLAQLLDLISTTVVTSPNIKWLVSSRNRSDIESRLKDASGEDRVRLDLELNSESIRNAVDVYIDHKLSELDRRKQYRQEVRVKIAQELRQKADGTFLWVAFVCKELESVANHNALKVLGKMPSKLKDLYGRMMQQIEKLELDDPKDCKSILSTVTLAYQPLHLDELATLTSIPNDGTLTELINECASFLTVRKDIVYFVHQSAKDYLTIDAEFKILPDGRAKGHGMMVSYSLDAMSKILRRDIYDLRDLSHLIEQVSCPDPDPLTRIRYACLHWIDHLCETDRNLYDQVGLCYNGSIDTFLKKYLLHWLEALSLMRNMSSGVNMIRKLENLLSASINKLPLLDPVRDTRRFILHNRWVIENAPLQIYVSALVFSPTHSLTREQWKKEEPEWMITKPIMESNWSPCLQTLEGHSSLVTLVVFSHDSQQLASASCDGTVKIWDAATGECLRTLKGHSDMVTSVMFSHDSKKLVSASYDQTVKAWDVATGKCLRTLRGHSAEVLSVTFSHDSQQLASASCDRAVKIWDVATGKCLRKLKGHSAEVLSVVFSHDSERLASASFDQTVKIWDAATGESLRTLEDHSDSVSSVMFSHDSQQLALASSDGTVRILDAATGECLRTLKGHSASVLSVVFSHDSKQLASASFDQTVKIWDAVTGECLRTLEGHNRLVKSIVFSHDSKQLASASYDQTVKIWDAVIGKCLRKLEGHSDMVSSVVFSHDSQQLASASADRTVKIWDVATGECLHTLMGHSSFVTSVVFSHDSKRLASASFDRTVKIWDAATGECLRTLKGHSGLVTSVVFSHDSERLTSASYDQTVKIWDAVTGKCLRTVEDHSDSVSLSKMDFDPADTYQFTEVSPVTFGRSSPVLHTLSESGDAVPSAGALVSREVQESKYSFGLSSDQSWITWDGGNVLWLPPEYRPTPSSFTVSGSTMVIGCQSGRVIIIRFLPALSFTMNTISS